MWVIMLNDVGDYVLIVVGRVRANVAVLSHGKKAVKSTFIHK